MADHISLSGPNHALAIDISYKLGGRRNNHRPCFQGSQSLLKARYSRDE